MYAHNIAYCYQNGEVQGFIGTGFTKAQAEENAYAKIRAKLNDIQQPYERERVITSWENVSDPDEKVIKADWDTQP